MKRLIKLTLIAVLFPLFSIGQSNYKPGYVVTLKGDTLKGFIDYREWDDNPNSINFKRSLNDQEPDKITTDNAGGFAINNLEFYSRYTGPLSMDPVNGTYPYRDTSFKVETVFLKVLEKGSKVALYAYKDDLKPRYFIGESPDYTPHELVYKLYGSHIENTFQKQLSAEASKYGALDDNLITYIAKSEYQESDILHIVSKINGISKAEYEKTHHSGVPFTFFAGTGLNMNTTTPLSSSPFYAAGGRAYTSYRPVIYFGINVFANPNTRKLQFSVELSATGNSLDDKYTSKVYPYVPDEAKYDALAFSGSVQILYNFYNAKNFKVFGGAGFIATSYSFSNNYIGAQDHNNSDVNLNATVPYEFNKFNDAFILKAGVQFTQKFAVFTEYQTSIAPANSPYFALSSTSTQIGVLYLFR
ncbi:MAG TPA: hypothetical protein VHC47_13085 [Mucilaginibacter sp.]|nr:hypothetical protein [Mucilaginibacter sp.]